jgi:zinc-finger of transposase IS204/IS1001/IS1096/IS1165
MGSPRECTRILDLDGFRVEHIEWEAEGSRAHLWIWLERRGIRGHACSGCGRHTWQVRDIKPRIWDDLPWAAHRVSLIYLQRRLRFRACGIRTERVTFADPKARITRRLPQVIGLDCQSMPTSHAAVRHGVGRFALSGHAQAGQSASGFRPKLSATNCVWPLTTHTGRLVWRTVCIETDGEARMKLIGIVLIIGGLVALVLGGIRYSTQDTVIDVGPVHATTEKHHLIPLPPVVGLASSLPAHAGASDVALIQTPRSIYRVQPRPASSRRTLRGVIQPSPASEQQFVQVVARRCFEWVLTRIAPAR